MNTLLELIAVLLLLYIAFCRDLLLSYAKKKGENRALREDAGSLVTATKEAEEPYALRQERFKQLLAIKAEGDRFRIDKYKALYHKLDSLKAAFSDMDVYSNAQDLKKVETARTSFTERIFELVAFLKANRLELRAHSTQIELLQVAINDLLVGQPSGTDVASRAVALANAVDEAKATIFFAIEDFVNVSISTERKAA